MNQKKTSSFRVLSSDFYFIFWFCTPCCWYINADSYVAFIRILSNISLVLHSDSIRRVKNWSFTFTLSEKCWVHPTKVCISRTFLLQVNTERHIILPKNCLYRRSSKDGWRYQMKRKRAPQTHRLESGKIGLATPLVPTATRRGFILTTCLHHIFSSVSQVLEI